MAESTNTDNAEFDIDNIENYTKEQIDEFVAVNFWKIRPCTDYSTEYDECSSIKGRFQQYFIWGELLDCSTWKDNYRNCEKCLDDDNKACAYVICAEEKRKRERLKAHLANDVWKKRDKPPQNWNKQLPDWAVEKAKTSYLKATEKSSCSIQ